MLNSIAANVIAGLGLFFSGLRMVDANLRQATGRRLRTLVGRFTQHWWLSALVGLVTGAVVQSTSGIVFILVSLVASGLTTVRRALPIVTWANVGCCALIFVAVLDLRLAILYLLGLAGAAFAFDRSHRNSALGALFGVGMLFYGVELMKIGAEPLKELPWFAAMLGASHNSLALALLGGAVMSFITQSSTAVSILAIGFAQGGLLGPFPAMMAIYGADAGSTFSRMLLSSTLKGSVRQVAAYQDLFKISGTILFVSLLYVEAFGHVPLVRAAVSLVSDRIDRQLALVFLLFNLVMAVIFSIGQEPVCRFLERRFPADAHEDLSKPQFLYDEALEEPATALDLIEREQLRLAECLRTYPAAMRASANAAQRLRAAALQAPFAALVAHIEQFQQELVDRHLGAHETERLTRLQNRLSLIVYLEDSLATLAKTAQSVSADTRLGDLIGTFVEGLDFVLMSLTKALDEGEREQVEFLISMTEDHGDLMEGVRQGYLTDETSVSAHDRAVLLQVTSTFERVIWMTQRLARLIDRQQRRQIPAIA